MIELVTKGRRLKAVVYEFAQGVKKELECLSVMPNRNGTLALRIFI